MSSQKNCAYCKASGHHINFCPNISCRRCGKYGHTDRVCGNATQVHSSIHPYQKKNPVSKLPSQPSGWKVIVLGIPDSVSKNLPQEKKQKKVYMPKKKTPEVKTSNQFEVLMVVSQSKITKPENKAPPKPVVRGPTPVVPKKVSSPKGISWSSIVLRESKTEKVDETKKLEKKEEPEKNEVPPEDAKMKNLAKTLVPSPITAKSSSNKHNFCKHCRDEIRETKNKDRFADYCDDCLDIIHEELEEICEFEDDFDEDFEEYDDEWQ